MTDNLCSCGTGPKLIFPCSGASDVGEISDRAARQLTKNGDGKMYCLAGIGGRVSGIVESTKSAAKILAIDGCKMDCAKKTLQESGFTEFEHMRVVDIEGIEKGKSPPTDERISQVVEKAQGLLIC